MTLEVVYIAGYGRSGSTLLERRLVSVLGANAVAAGEWEWLPKYFADQACSCGEALAHCEIWSALSSVPLQGRPPRLIPTSASIKLWTEIREVLERRGVTAVVDSSKTARRSILRPVLLRRAGFIVRVVMPVRSLSAVIASRRANYDRSGRRTGWWVDTETAFSWLAAIVAGRCYRPLVLRFEDLVIDPENVVRRLLAESGMHVGVEGAEHLVAGNRMRHRDLGSPPKDSERAQTRGTRELGGWVSLTERLGRWVAGV